MFKKLLKVIPLVILFASFSALGQVPDCPPNTEPNDWTLHEYHLLEMGPNNFWGTVDYQSRTTSGGKTEIVVDWSTFQNWRDYLKDETVKEIIQTDIVFANTDPCPFTGSQEVSVVYKTECTIDKKCVLRLDASSTTVCCDDPNFNPDIYERNNVWYYNAYQKQSCGYKCCEKIFTVKCDADRKYIDDITTNTYPGSTCNGGSVEDCLGDGPIPCEGNCE
jgi:hypothetical protein